METAHRQIELQFPEDFTYLVENVRRAAADSIAAAFPPVAGQTEDDQRDDLHARVEALVNEYIHRTFVLAAPNLTINGLPVDPAPFFDTANSRGSKHRKNGKKKNEKQQQFEPFDARKRQRVEALAREEEDLLRDIAALKRRVPPAAVQARERWLEGALSADTAAAAATEAAVAEEATRSRASGKSKPNDLDNTATTYAEAVAGLSRLKQAMPATVARMERARVAGEYALAER